MKTPNLNKVLVMAVLLATSPFAKAQALSSSDIQTVRGVLRALSINEAELSNQDIETLRNQGLQLNQYEDSKKQIFQQIQKGVIERTGGAGSHGGDKDPV